MPTNVPSSNPELSYSQFDQVMKQQLVHAAISFHHNKKLHASKNLQFARENSILDSVHCKNQNFEKNLKKLNKLHEVQNRQRQIRRDVKSSQAERKRAQSAMERNSQLANYLQSYAQRVQTADAHVERVKQEREEKNRAQSAKLSIVMEQAEAQRNKSNEQMADKIFTNLNQHYARYTLVSRDYVSRVHSRNEARDCRFGKTHDELVAQQMQHDNELQQKLQNRLEHAQQVKQKQAMECFKRVDAHRIHTWKQIKMDNERWKKSMEKLKQTNESFANLPNLYEVEHVQGMVLRKRLTKCAMCEQCFPMHVMNHTSTLAAIRQFRDKQILEAKHAIAATLSSLMYDAVKVCVFCSQILAT